MCQVTRQFDLVPKLPSVATTKFAHLPDQSIQIKIW